MYVYMYVCMYVEIESMLYLFAYEREYGLPGGTLYKSAGVALLRCNFDIFFFYALRVKYIRNQRTNRFISEKGDLTRSLLKGA